MSMAGFCYVYILETVAEPRCYYVGLTQDLRARLTYHNSGRVPHTAKRLPWRIATAIAFRDRRRASSFERYLKSASGRAFARKHL